MPLRLRAAKSAHSTHDRAATSHRIAALRALQHPRGHLGQLGGPFEPELEASAADALERDPADAEGNAYEVGETIALCRCGQSGTKPFCDGTHERTSFTALDRAGALAR